jgi:hypothetical protein
MKLNATKFEFIPRCKQRGNWGPARRVGSELSPSGRVRRIRTSKGARGSLFISATQKTPEPVTAPKADNARWTGPPQYRRISTKNARRCGDVVLWGCFKTCINLVSFDGTPFGPSSTLSSDRRELMAEGRTVSLSNGRSTTSEQMVVKLKRDPHAPHVS